MVSTLDAQARPVAPTGSTSVQPVDLQSVRLTGGFLGDWQQLNADATISHCIARLGTSGVLDNFRRLAGRTDVPFRGPEFADSDLYKTLEALGWEAARGTRLSEHDGFYDEAVELIDAVQEPDGYVDTYFQGPRAGERLTDLAQGHEFYCLGHLVQAAIAWHHAGDDRLLTIASRYVDLVHREFGAGGRDDLDGHPEIETALVELSRVTGEDRHRELARRMLELRGHRTIGEGQFGAAYYQDTVPVGDAREATGHAVRQLYLLAGITDVQTDDPDAGYKETLDALWNSVHTEKLYVTGGLGSRHRGEAFGDPYELPADRAYSETCAAIANLHWNWRMLLLRGDSRYADEMERGLYNAIAVSTATDGKSFFYSNPLQLRTGHDHEEDAPSSRLDWYACACCPPNLARLMASISGYVLTTSADGAQFHLYAAGTYDLGDGVTATVDTQYPWDGRIAIELNRPSERGIDLRIPAWAAGAATLVIDDGEPVNPDVGYARVPAGAEKIVLTLPVQPVFEHAHPWVDGAREALALRRGPVYYALEQADLPEGVVLEDVRIPKAPTAGDGGWDVELGAPVLTIDGATVVPRPTSLYAVGTDSAPPTSLGSVRAIPYFRWANRTPGAMRVWMPTA